MKRFSVEDIIALNDEIMALSRAGIPIGRGLLDMGADMPKRLEAATKIIGERLEQGESLADIVGSEEAGLPPIYSAVVRAGIESGRLPVALERLSTTLARVAELRRVVTLAAVYPLFIVLLGCGLISFVAVPLLRTVRETFLFHEASIPWWLTVLFDLGIRVGPFAIIAGVGVVALAIIWFIVSNFSMGSRIWLARLVGWLPGVRNVVNAGRTAAFLETLQLLVSQDVPLNRALTLAADSTGDPVLQLDAAAVAASIQRGGNAVAVAKLHSIPPLVEWLLATQQSRESLCAALDSMVNSYTDRTQRAGDLLRTMLPMWFTVVLGGSVTMIYVICVMIPWATMMNSLADL